MQHGIGHHLQFAQQPGDVFALADDLGFVADRAVATAATLAQSQRAHLGLQSRQPHCRLHQHAQRTQTPLRGGVEGADGQRIQRQRAPELAFQPQTDAHAVVHRQRLAGARIEQTVVGVGQDAVVVKAGDLAPRQDRCQPRVLRHGEPPAQRITRQPGRGDRPQVFALELQQRHRATAETGAQRIDQVLQAHCLRQIDPAVGHQKLFDHGS